MGLTPEAKRKITEGFQTKDQQILSNKILIKDFPLEPYTPYLKTNNFIQQGVNRLLGFSDSEGKWVTLKVNPSGELLVNRDISTPAAIATADREAISFLLIDNQTIGPNVSMTHGAIDTGNFHHITAFVASDASITIRIQGSNDDVNWYDLKTAADADVSFDCTNERIMFDLPLHATHMRLVLTNTGAANVIATAEIFGVV